MPVKIRLARRGRKKQPFYHIIVADARSPRDGKFIESIGSYNPMTRPATIDLDREKAYEWLMKGAQPTETARAILRFKGVLYKKHLQRGVSKGAMTQEQADELFNQYVEEKEGRIAARKAQTEKEKLDFYKKVSGSTTKQYVEEKSDDAAAEAFREQGEAASEATEATAETGAEKVETVEAVGDTAETAATTADEEE